MIKESFLLSRVVSAGWLARLRLGLLLAGVSVTAAACSSPSDQPEVGLDVSVQCDRLITADELANIAPALAGATPQASVIDTPNVGETHRCLWFANSQSLGVSLTRVDQTTRQKLSEFLAASPVIDGLGFEAYDQSADPGTGVSGFIGDVYVSVQHIGVFDIGSPQAAALAKLIAEK